jgi:hypothetical protein
MTRALARWLLRLVLLTCLGPELAWACKPAPHKAWTKRSPNGRFTLSMKGAGSDRGGFARGPLPLTLRNARKKVIWKQDVSYFYESEALISPSGRYVAAVSDGGAVVLFGPKGQQVGSWNVREALTKAEQDNIPVTSCGPMVLGETSFQGDVLELEAHTSVMNRPDQPQPEGTRFRIDPQKLQLTRVTPLPAETPAEPPPPPRQEAPPQGSAAALKALEGQPPSAALFEKLLPFCQDPDREVRQRAVEQQLRLMESRGPERKALLAALRKADADGKLEPFPEGWIILGGLADLDNKRPRALELYARGAKALSASLSPESRSRGSAELLFEALLQLAMEAKKQNRQDELSQRVHDVLAYSSSRDFYVSAPKPNRYATTEPPAASKRPEERKSAMLVAKEFLLKPGADKASDHHH